MSGGRNELRPRSRPASGMRASSVKVATWPCGVDAGVGAAGAADRHGLAGHRAHRLFQAALHGAQPGLLLPAVKVGAVVLDEEAEVSRRRRWIAIEGPI